MDNDYVIGKLRAARAAIGDIVNHIKDETETDANGKLDDADTLAISTAAMAGTVAGTLVLMARMIDALED